MRKFLSRLIIPFFTATTCAAQIVHSPAKPDYIQFGAYSKAFSSAFSFVSNQATLASLQHVSAGVYSEEKFSLKELSLSTIVLAVPFSSGGAGLEATYFGNSDYNESQLGIAYAKKLGGAADIGVQFNYYQVQMSGYGNYSTVNFEIAALFHPSEKVHAGFHVYNPLGGKIGKNAVEKLASVYEAGLGYDASEQVCINAVIRKEENKVVDVNAGLQYVFARQFFARLGIASSTALLYAGAGWSWKNIRLDVAVSYHQQLGFSPGLMLLYDFKNKD